MIGRSQRWYDVVLHKNLLDNLLITAYQISFYFSGVNFSGKSLKK
ncbi:hypothetical protein ELI_1875 [Eubacterium callanderi]|uniref:Uncharacterized protein n=1 Tax=Eubacterium callanderi TaxID=53442 RepID=E3GMB8_9FIRM|nr:hypothetical protein ELI_1875 [Eubacterium callanderi]